MSRSWSDWQSQRSLESGAQPTHQEQPDLPPLPPTEDPEAPPLPPEYDHVQVPPPPPPPSDFEYDPQPPWHSSGVVESNFPPGFGPGFVARSEQPGAQAQPSGTSYDEIQGRSQDEEAQAASGLTGQNLQAEPSYNDAAGQHWNAAWAQQPNPQYPGYDMQGNFIGSQDPAYAAAYGYQTAQHPADPQSQYAGSYQAYPTHPPDPSYSYAQAQAYPPVQQTAESSAWSAPQESTQVWPLSTQYAQVKNEIEAEDIIKHPGRNSRPPKIAIIMRGLPGSGKTHIAKKLKDLEAELGGENPRIHALDDYFMTEVEKEELVEEPGKKPKRRKITSMEYVYEEELEETYKQSMLKAFAKTVEESRFPFVILDAPNIQVEDFKPFYMAAQRCGYEVYVLKPLETNAQVCYERNIHNRDEDTINDLAALYEPTPNLFTQILVESLFDLARSRKSRPREGEEVDDVFDQKSPEDNQKETEEQVKPQSRWASMEDDAEEGLEEDEEDRRKKKKRKKDKHKSKDRDEEKESKAGTTEQAKPAARSLLAPQHRWTSSTELRSILKRSGAPSDKSVCWADEAVALEGFSLGGSATQLEKIYVLADLGPDPGHQSHPTQKSFDELAQTERRAGEGRSFKDILLGRG